MVCGITAAIGYRLGVLAACMWRAFAGRDPRHPRGWAWRTFVIVAVAAFVVSFGLGQYRQYEIRKLMGVTDYSIPLVVAAPFVAALVFCLFLLIGRSLRGLYRWLAQLLNRWIGRRAANAVGWILVAGLAYLVITGLLLDGLVNVINEAYSVRDTRTAEGVAPAYDQLAFGRAGLARAVGFAGLARRARRGFPVACAASRSSRRSVRQGGLPVGWRLGNGSLWRSPGTLPYSVAGFSAASPR